jgi:rfaE bifunctional protein kinase chain/domain
MQNVLVIGDAMLDIYTFGHIHRISPEAPVPEFIKNGQETFKVGGAANTAINIKSLGDNVTLIAGIGDDTYATQFLNLLEEYEIVIKTLQLPCTTVKQRFVDVKFNQHVLRVAQENTAPDIDNDTFLDILCQANKPDIVVISDYDKGILNKYRIQTIISTYEDIPVIVDPKIRNFKHYNGISIIMPNHSEVAKELGISEKELLRQPANYANNIADNLNIENVAITLGKQGVALATNTFVGIIPTIERQVFDVTGAGDVFCAVVACLWNDYDIKHTIIQIANHIAGKSVETLGNYVATPADINEAQQLLNI